MVTQTFTLPQFKSYMDALPKKIQKSADSINKDMSDSLARRIKFNLHEVAQSSTGNLRKSIKSSPNGKGRYKVTGAGYWRFLNEGKFPNSIPAQFISQHAASPGTPGSFVANPIWIYPKNTANKGFVDRSRESLKKDTVKIIERGIAKALVK